MVPGERADLLRPDLSSGHSMRWSWSVSLDIGYALAGLTEVGIIFIGARFLLAPSTAAAGFGIAA
jgi:hypothetical protein